MTLLQHHLLALGLIFLTTISVGLFVLLKNPQKLTNRIFSIYSLTVAWWSLWELLTEFSLNEAVAVTRLRIEYIGVCFIPVLFYHVVLNLTGTKKHLGLYASYLLGTGFTILISLMRHRTFLPDAVPMAYLPYWAKAGPLYPLFILFFTFYVLHGHYTLWKGIQREPVRLKRKQLQYFLFSSMIAYIAAIPEFSLKLGLRIPILQPYGLYSVPIYMILVAYAIVQFELFDIHVVIRKSLIYSILVTFLTAGYFGLVYGIERIFQIALGYQSIWTSLAAFALMALAFQPLKVGIQRAVDLLIFRVPQEAVVKRMERLEQEAIRSEKLKAISTLAAGMAHEIKNPLTAIKTFSESVSEFRDDPTFMKQYNETMPAEISRIQRIVQDLLNFAKPKSPELKPVELGPLIHSTVSLLSSELSKRHIHWTVTCQHNGAAPQADADQLRQVLINLVQNAAEAMPDGGTLTITTQTNDGHWELQVSDTGQGIPKELLPKIFDPFVTTKEHGNGLGLAMVYSIIQAHHGTIHVASTPGHGTTFTLRLPP